VLRYDRNPPLETPRQRAAKRCRSRPLRQPTAAPATLRFRLRSAGPLRSWAVRQPSSQHDDRTAILPFQRTKTGDERQNDKGEVLCVHGRGSPIPVWRSGDGEAVTSPRRHHARRSLVAWAAAVRVTAGLTSESQAPSALRGSGCAMGRPWEEPAAIWPARRLVATIPDARRVLLARPPPGRVGRKIGAGDRARTAAA
jgi:hypothetical protein